MHKSLKDLFPAQEFSIHSGYENLFELLMLDRQSHRASDLEAAFSRTIEAYFQAHPLQKNDFEISKTYTRQPIGRDASGWESMISRWEKGAVSSIHGHPDFIFYYVLDGAFEMPLYERSGSGAKQVETVTLKAGESIASVGAPGDFDNMIHQVKALETSFVLHIFSDDPLKGLIF